MNRLYKCIGRIWATYIWNEYKYRFDCLRVYDVPQPPCGLWVGGAVVVVVLVELVVLVALVVVWVVGVVVIIVVAAISYLL